MVVFAGFCAEEREAEMDLPETHEPRNRIATNPVKGCSFLQRWRWRWCCTGEWWCLRFCRRRATPCDCDGRGYRSRRRGRRRHRPSGSGGRSAHQAVQSLCQRKLRCHCYSDCFQRLSRKEQKIALLIAFHSKVVHFLAFSKATATQTLLSKAIKTLPIDKSSLLECFQMLLKHYFFAILTNDKIIVVVLQGKKSSPCA